MTNYDELKNTVIAWDSVLGLITLEMFLEDISFFIKEQEEFEDEIVELLENINCNQNVINETMKNSTLHVIKFYINLIQGIF